MTSRRNQSPRMGSNRLLALVGALWGARFVLAASTANPAIVLLLVVDGLNTMASWRLARYFQDTAHPPLDTNHLGIAVFVLPILSALLTIQSVLALARSTGLAVLG